MIGFLEMRTLLAAMAMAIAMASASTASADVVIVNQEQKKFSVTEITVKRGQSVTFVNSDPFTHNVYSVTPGMSFDLQVQKPDQRDVVTFDTPGEAAVRCAIHPQMKLTIKVAP
jgi:plastocyanin